MRRGGIRYEIVLNMTVLALFAILLTAIFIFKLLEEHLLSQEVENSKIFAEAVRKDFEFFIQKEAVSSQPDQRISNYANRVLLSHRINQLSVADPRGMILAEVKRQTSNSTPVSEEVLKHQVKRAIVWRDMQVEIERARLIKLLRVPTIVISQPVTKDNQVWGAMVLCFDAQGLSGLSPSGVKFFLIYMFMVAAILAGFGIILMSKIIVDPVLKLVEHTRKISEGNFSSQIHVGSRNEIGALAQSFNDMSEKIKVMLEEREVNLKKLEESNQLLKNAQDEIVRNEKLATVGRISAGVAHEIGNPIGAIMGYAELLQSGVSAEQARDLNQRIGKEASRVDRIIRDLLDLSRPQRMSFHPINLDESLVRSQEIVCRQAVFEAISFRFDLNSKGAMVLSDPHIIDQVWVNLFTNAAKAMKGPGTLTVRSKSGTFKEFSTLPIFAGATRFWEPTNEVTLNEIEGREVVCVEVEDSGPGVDPEILAHIFEPFVTTREPGEGTGLGLHIVARLLEEMVAVIGVRNLSSGGAVFSIIFPKEK